MWIHRLVPCEAAEYELGVQRELEAVGVWGRGEQVRSNPHVCEPTLLPSVGLICVRSYVCVRCGVCEWEVLSPRVWGLFQFVVVSETGSRSAQALLNSGVWRLQVHRPPGLVYLVVGLSLGLPAR